MNSTAIINLIQSADQLLAYFSHEDCSVCKTLRPKVKSLTEKTGRVQFCYVNIREHPQISGQNMVFTVPTIILFQKGREVKRFSRHFSLDELEYYIERLEPG